MLPPQIHGLDIAAQDTTLISVVEAIARGNPSIDFLVETPTTSLTYSDFYKLTTQLLPHYLIRLYPNFLQPGAKVAIISPNNPLVPLASWTLWHLGVITVPLSMTSEPSLWVSMLETAGVELVFLSNSANDRLSFAFDAMPSVQKPVIALLDTIIPPQYSYPSIIQRCHRWLSDTSPSGEETARTIISSTSTAVVLFTSSAIDASTLKCVAYSHAAMLHGGWRAIQGVSSEKLTQTPMRHLGWLPLSHCFELTASLCGFVLCTGGTYIFHNPAISSPSASASTALPLLLLEALEFHQPVDSFCSVPAILESLPRPLSASQLSALRTLRHLVVGGAPTPSHLWNWAADLGLNYIDMAGATEAAGAMSYRKCSESNKGSIVLPGIMGILEKNDKGDDFGELILLGEYLPRGYQNLQTSSFCYDSHNGTTTYRTGDLYQCTCAESPMTFVLGEQPPVYSSSAPALEGLTYLGRMDDMIVLASGLKVNALALERQLDSQPEISRSAVVASANDLVALVIPSKGTHSDTVIAAVLVLNADIPYEKRFKKENIIVTDDLPVTTKGTLHRKLLRRKLSENGGIWPSLKFSSTGATATLPGMPPRPSKPIGMVRPASEVSVELHLQIAKLLADTLSIPLAVAQDPEVTFANLQVSSLATVQFASALRRALAVDITAAQLYGLMNIDELCAWIVNSNQSGPRVEASQSDVRMPPKDETGDQASGRLAITGAVCRFPGGIDSLSKLWDALLSPHSPPHFIQKPPPSRWTTRPGEDIPPMGWLTDLEHNDVHSFSSFFGVVPSEVEGWTHNARLALKMGYRALEDAGIAPGSIDGRKWGVFTSVNDSGWRERKVHEIRMDDYGKSWTGTADDAVGARLAYFLNLTGPSVEIKTACSSSAVAVHQACSAIRNGDCEAALIVASTTFFSPASSIARLAAGIVSKQGRCATFSDEADGYLPSEGTAAIVIQRSAGMQAEPYGYIRASAVAQTGRSRGFGAPNPHSQAQLIQDTLARAGCVPGDISYLEAHGTGTRLGDVIEIDAVNKVFGHKRTVPLVVGSVKAVIGHTEECAGLAGILKALVCLRHDIIPPQPGVNRVSPELNLCPAPIIIPRRPLALPQIRRDGLRLVGVSSFGLSGTLAHLILEGKPHVFRNSQAERGGAMVITARSPTDLKALVQSFLHFAESPEAEMTNLMHACKTMQLGRDHFRYRIAWHVHTWKQLGEKLQQALVEDAFDSIRRVARQGPEVTLWFALPHEYRSFPPEKMHPYCADLLAGYRAKGCTPELEYFAGQLAFTRFLEFIGCHVSAVGGEGICELVAAAAAGLIDDTSLFGLLSSTIPFQDARTTCSIKCADDELWTILCGFDAQQLRISAQYGPGAFQLIGTKEAIASLKGSLSAPHEIQENHPIVSHHLPSHISLLLRPPCCPVISGHLCGPIDKDVIMSQQYWLDVMTRPWDGHTACQELVRLGDVIINIGSNFTLPEVQAATPVLDSLSGVDDISCQLFQMGVDVPWGEFGSSDGPLVHLPTYCWDYQ